MSAIRGIVAKALCELVSTEAKGLALRVSEEKCYVTIFESQQEDRIKINSVWTRPKREHYVVVDFTTPLMYDDKKYMQHGMDLRDQFLEVPEWYHC